MVRKGNPKNIQAIDDVCGVRRSPVWAPSRRPCSAGSVTNAWPAAPDRQQCRDQSQEMPAEDQACSERDDHLHEVTLGGTGKERADRHPKVRDGVLLCAGAKVLGNVEIGRDAKVGAGSVVLHDVPPRATVAGVPALIVGWSSGSVPALEMDQSLPDYEI